jgi:hypothetical protein
MRTTRTRPTAAAIMFGREKSDWIDRCGFDVVAGALEVGPSAIDR